MSRASRDFIGQSLSQGIASVAQGYIEGQKKKRQQDLFKEYVSKDTPLPRKQEIALEIAPKEFFKMQQQKENDEFLQGLLKQQFEQEQEDQTIENSQQPIEQQNQMGVFNANTMQIPSQIPDVNQLREQLGNMEPIQGNQSMGQQQQQVDALESKIAKAQRLQQLGLIASSKNPTLGNQISNQAKEIFADVRGEQKNRAMVESSKIRAEATMAKTAQKQKSEQTNQVLPIQQKAIENYKAAETTSFALDNMLASVKNRDVGIWSEANLSKILEEAGYPTLALAAQTQGTALFKTNAKTIFAGAREIFPKMTNYDAKVFEQMMPSVGRDETANEVSIETLKFPQQAKMEEAKFVMNVLSQNPDISAIELNSKTFNHMQDFKDKLYNEWHEKLVRWELSQKPERRSIFSSPNSKNTNAKLQNIWG